MPISFPPHLTEGHKLTILHQTAFGGGDHWVDDLSFANLAEVLVDHIERTAIHIRN